MHHSAPKCPCNKNNTRKLCEDFEGWTLEKPDNGYNGNLRHFFSKPDEELMNKLMYKNKSEKQPYQAPYHRFIGRLLFVYLIISRGESAEVEIAAC